MRKDSFSYSTLKVRDTLMRIDRAPVGINETERVPTQQPSTLSQRAEPQGEGERCERVALRGWRSLVKRAGLRLLWLVPARVQIPPPALHNPINAFAATRSEAEGSVAKGLGAKGWAGSLAEGHRLCKPEVGGSNPPRSIEP